MKKRNWDHDSIIMRIVLAWVFFSPWIAKFVFKCSWGWSLKIMLLGPTGIMVAGIVFIIVVWPIYYIFTGKDLFI